MARGHHKRSSSSEREERIRKKKLKRLRTSYSPEVIVFSLQFVKMEWVGKYGPFVYSFHSKIFLALYFFLEILELINQIESCIPLF